MHGGRKEHDSINVSWPVQLEIENALKVGNI